MTKYAIVPVELLKDIKEKLNIYFLETDGVYPGGKRNDQLIQGIDSAMLAARPPLPADMQAAVELARKYCAPSGGNISSTELLTDTFALARALLRAAGEDTP